jgi:hypothetical protein
MNEITPLETWIRIITKALQEKNLIVTHDPVGAGHFHGRLLAMLPGVHKRKYEIRFICESVDGSGYGPRRFYAMLVNPKVRRTVRIKVFNAENVASIASYAATSLASWQAADANATLRAGRAAFAESLANAQQIDSNSLPAWIGVAPNVENAEDAGTYRVTLRACVIGYPLKRLTPEQVKRVLHFIKFIDKPAPSAMNEISAAVDKAGLYDAAPACTCDCLPCQSCDHK